MSMGMLSKDKLILDTANLADSDNVGAYLRASDGTLLTHTTISGKEALDVNIANTSIAVSATDLDIRNLDYSQDNVAIKGATGNQLVVNADGSINVQADISVVNGSDKTEDSASANGDVGTFILAVRQDALTNSTSADGDYGALKLTQDGALWVAPVGNVADDAVDSGNPLKIGSKYLSTLTALSTSGDRADLISDKYRRIYTNHSANVAMAVSATSVGTSAIQIASSPLSGRKSIMIQNKGSKAIFIGSDNTVTTGTGFEVSAGAVFSMDIGENIQVWAISSTASQSVKALEMA